MTSATTSATPRLGPTTENPNAITFSLFAPGKQSVHLIGPFNDWSREADALEQAEPGLWTITKELPPGEHRYQYFIDGQTILCDPYARQIERPEGDLDPDKPPVAIVRVGQPSYEWKYDAWQRPPFRDLVIYELHVADFTAEGTFDAVRQKLDYLADLGVNAIELMPVTEVQLKEGWGYQPAYYFAARGSYGSPEDLKRLIDEAHGRGIAIILDVVLAHSGPGCPFNLLYDNLDDSPWYGHGIGGDNFYGLPTFDHRKPGTQELMREIQRYWLDEFHVDGFRYDYVVNIGIDGEDGLPRLIKQARAIRPDAYLIGEYLPEDPKLIGLCECDAAWHVRSSYALKALAMEKELNGYSWTEFEHAFRAATDPGHEGYEKASHMVNYIESHDEHRLVHELRDAGATPDGSRRRLALAAAVLFTAPGVPMLYQGQEFGETAHLTVNERNPLRWELLSTEGGKGLFEHYRDLIALRRKHPALRDEGFKIEAISNDEKWAVFHRWNEHGDVVMIACNFGGEVRTIDVLLPKPGPWRDVERNQTVERGEGDTVPITLHPSEVAVFVPAEA